MCIRSARKIDPPIEYMTGYKIAVREPDGTLRSPYTETRLEIGTRMRAMHEYGGCAAHWDEDGIPGFHFYFNLRDAVVESKECHFSYGLDVDGKVVVVRCEMGEVNRIGWDGTHGISYEHSPKVGTAEFCTIVEEEV